MGRWAIWVKLQVCLVALLAGQVILGHATVPQNKTDPVLLPHVRHLDILERYLQHHAKSDVELTGF